MYLATRVNLICCLVQEKRREGRTCGRDFSIKRSAAKKRLTEGSTKEQNCREYKSLLSPATWGLVWSKTKRTHELRGNLQQAIQMQVFITGVLCGYCQEATRVKNVNTLWHLQGSFGPEYRVKRDMGREVCYGSWQHCCPCTARCMPTSSVQLPGQSLLITAGITQSAEVTENVALLQSKMTTFHPNLVLCSPHALPWNTSVLSSFSVSVACNCQAW